MLPASARSGTGGFAAARSAGFRAVACDDEVFLRRRIEVRAHLHRFLETTGGFRRLVLLEQHDADVVVRDGQLGAAAERVDGARILSRAGVCAAEVVVDAPAIFGPGRA